MSVQEDSISKKIKQKLDALVSAYESVRQENEELISRKKELELLLQNKEKAYVELNEHFSRVKVAKALQHSSPEVHDAKIKVNRIVREIDKCIALLNR